MKTRSLPQGLGGDLRIHRRESDWLWLLLASLLWSWPGLAGLGEAVVASAAPAGSLSLAEALDAPRLLWTTGGDFVWIAQTNITHDGQDAAQGKVDYLETETWVATMVSGPGTITFYWKTICNGALDRLAFYVDTDLRGSISGQVDWDSVLVDVPAGVHTLQWVFEVASEPYGDYGAWLDEVSYVQEGPPYILGQPVDQTVSAGATVSFQVVAQGVGVLRY
jgi:hypothetical protein